MSDLITYDNKIRLKSQNVSEKYKVTAGDMNEIKSVVNTNAEEMDLNKAEVRDDIAVINNNITDLNNNKLDINAVLNQASTDTDKPYSADYLNDKLVSVGTTAPENGERVWFKKGKNLINYEDFKGTITNYYFVGLPSTNFALEAGKTYTLSLNINSSVTPFAMSVGAGQRAYAVDIKQTGPYQNGRNSITFTPTETQLANGNILFFRAPRYGTSQSSVTFTISDVQLEEGSTATPYEPYVEPAIYVDGMKIYEMS